MGWVYDAANGLVRRAVLVPDIECGGGMRE